MNKPNNQEFVSSNPVWFFMDIFHITWVIVKNVLVMIEKTKYKLKRGRDVECIFQNIKVCFA